MRSVEGLRRGARRAHDGSSSRPRGGCREPRGARAAPSAGPAAGDPGADKARIDGRIAGLREEAQDAEQRAGVLTEELSAVAGRVRELEAGVDAQRARLAVLEGQLAGARRRLGSLDRTIADQSKRLERLRGEYRVALRRLERRVQELYMTDGPDVLSFVLGTASFTDILDNLELLGRIGKQDERIASRVKASRDGVADARRLHPARAARSGTRRGGGRLGDLAAARGASSPASWRATRARRRAARGNPPARLDRGRPGGYARGDPRARGAELGARRVDPSAGTAAAAGGLVVRSTDRPAVRQRRSWLARVGACREWLRDALGPHAGGSTSSARWARPCAPPLPGR